MREITSSVFFFCTEYEYGWNDPPSSCYSAAASSSQKTASGKLTHLTRRPCHPPPHATPPTTPSSTATPPPVLTAPPTTTTYNGGADATKKTTSQSTTDERSTDLGIYDNADFTEVIQRLNDLTDSLREKFQVRVYNDIKRRLDLLSAQFTNDKLSPAVKLKMGQMVAGMCS